VKVSAVVCTRERPDLLVRCLPTVLAAEYQPREVLVVDQSADRRTRDLVHALQRDQPDLLYIDTPTRGLSAARNVAAERASGAILAFTDDDCLADPGWLRAVADEFRATPTTAAVCGRSLPRVEVPLIAGPASVRTDQSRRVFRGPSSPWRVGNGSNMALSAQALRAIGGFDERLGPGSRFRGGEEADLLYRLLRAGQQLVYSPLPLVHHRQWRTAAQQLALAHDYGVGVGAFAAKHFCMGDPRVVRMLGGWIAATLAELVRGMRAGDAGRARAARAFLSGLVVGVGEMALQSSLPPAP
jgi:GT2 family glycosyltransferase